MRKEIMKKPISRKIIHDAIKMTNIRLAKFQVLQLPETVKRKVRNRGTGQKEHKRLEVIFTFETKIIFLNHSKIISRDGNKGWEITGKIKSR